jgi:uncharacterized repeat protein (TIGR03803 family)
LSLGVVSIRVSSRWNLPLSLLLAVFTCFSFAAAARAQESNVYVFVGEPDGADPTSNLIWDAQGNLYGTTAEGGLHNDGMVFELSPVESGGWTKRVLYNFGAASSDGASPQAGLTMSPAGDLFGTTATGGTSGRGAVFELSPSTGGAWTETVIYSFGASPDGDLPSSSLALDSQGNLYGSTTYGSVPSAGMVFELSPSGGETWTEKVLYGFGKTAADGSGPNGVILGSDNNLYGSTQTGGANGGGTVFKLSAGSGGVWTLTTLYSFSGTPDGNFPSGSLIIDAQGNLYGTTFQGGAYTVPPGGGGSGEGLGTAYELSPAAGGGWTETILHSFGAIATDGLYPNAGLTLDTQGNLYATTQAGGDKNKGAVVELTPVTGGGWTESVTHNFKDVSSDGAYPYGGLTLDSAGNLYGAASAGADGYGSVYEVDSVAPVSPQFSPAPGQYSTSQMVSISDVTAGTTIYYTTNGDTPTASSTQYTDPIPVSGAVTVKAIATASGLPQSRVATGNYHIGPGAWLTSPTPGSTLASASATFSWTSGTSVTQYRLTVGTTGAGSSNVYDSGAVAARSESLTGLPVNGVTLFVRLWSEISGDWQSDDYTFLEAVLAPQVTLSAPSVSFGAQKTGIESNPVQVNLINTGNAALDVSSIGLVGANPSQFIYGTTTACSTVAPGATCTFRIRFSPTAPGIDSAAIAINDNAPGSPQMISLSGTATGTPIVSLSATSEAFGSIALNSESAVSQVTLTNTGNAPLSISSIGLSGPPANNQDYEFVISTTTSCATVAPAGTCVIRIQFAPTVAGDAIATLNIYNNVGTGKDSTITLTGTGVQAGPTASLSSVTAAFGNQGVNSESAAQVVTLTNTGNAALNISSIALTGTGAAQFIYGTTTSCATVAAQGTCTFRMRFYPKAAGAASAAIQITDNASGSPQSIALSGTGISGPVVSLSATAVAFGSQGVNTESDAQVLTLTNSGGQPLSISSIALTGTGAAQFIYGTTTSCATVAAQGTCTFRMRFYPKAAGAASAAIQITDNAPGSPQSIALSGTGISGPAVSLSATAVAFGSQGVNTESGAQVVTLTNSGGQPLNISSIALTGTGAAQFIYGTTSSCATVAPQGTCTFRMRFYPKAAGAASAAIQITDNASGSPQQISLSGTGH